jgi:hypothetical protein
MTRSKVVLLSLCMAMELLLAAFAAEPATAEFATGGDLAAQAPTHMGVPLGSLNTPLSERLRSLLGLCVLLAIAWGLSVDRSKISWRVVGWGLGLQFTFALITLKTRVGGAFFDAAGSAVVALLQFTTYGAQFVFGNLVCDTVSVGVVGQGGFEKLPGQVAQTSATFAFNVLPTIIFFSALVTVLYHLGIMQVRCGPWLGSCNGRWARRVPRPCPRLETSSWVRRRLRC